MAKHLKLGKTGEDAAVRHLENLRYRIIERNYRCRFGEVDIIALDKRTVVFVEVKTRSTDSYGSPEMSITMRKQRQLARVALSYLQNHNLLHRDARFDVVAVRQGEHNQDMYLIKNAFEISPWLEKR